MKQQLTATLTIAAITSAALFTPDIAEARGSSWGMLSALMVSAFPIYVIHSAGESVKDLSIGVSNFTVNSVKSGAKASTVLVEAMGTGAKYSLQLPTKVLGTGSEIIGKTLIATTSASGTMLTNSGKAIAFLPNELGKSLIHHSKHEGEI